ncbi:serine hydrolase [Streptomyces mangrovisoli]|uniref:Serine hydrolase n=1 Tax=Streptomyces mangrovisoli TaxID=1428628 RepID=A0A1J4NVV7_9ACTN|nr:serine hydrolase [Streptomyces mangrovisoli]OIJ65357.1 serine hydrolase [Streptomyces mangrovisoli]
MARRSRRNRPRRLARAGAAVAPLSALALALSGCGDPVAVRGGPAPATSLSPTPPAQPSPQLTPAQVTSAVGRLDGIVQDVMRQTGVPGVAVGVVHHGTVVYAKGFGVREVGRSAPVDPATVFQLASLSKPLSSTVVAGAVGRKTVGWDDPVVTHDPGFALKNSYVTANVTIADLFSHRSGLPDHAGDLLEDLGYSQDYILHHLRLEPLAPFRASYAYTNYGLTEAGEAVADAAGTPWSRLAADTLFRPLGMTHTSYRRADYDSAADKASAHVEVDGHWKVSTTENADRQAPAGGASSNVEDLTKWMRLQLDDGTFEGRRLVDATALNETRVPHIVSSPPRAAAGEPGFYGLGWNVGYDDGGAVRLSHSGAFDLGAATTITLLPAEGLGIVVLTNGQPIGAPEAVAATFLDIARNGRQTVDWLPFYRQVVQAAAYTGVSPTDYAKPPAHPAPAHAAAAYTGTYANDYYGPLTVTADPGGNLSMTLGPQTMSFPLTHYTGDTFSYRTQGENAVGLSGVTFHLRSGRATGVTVEHLDANKLGTFTR